MALLNPQTGEYLKVIDVILRNDGVYEGTYIIYKNQNVREFGICEYDNVVSGSINSGILNQYMRDPSKIDPSLDMVNNAKRIVYLAAKADNYKFSNWSDV